MPASDRVQVARDIYGAYVSADRGEPAMRQRTSAERLADAQHVALAVAEPAAALARPLARVVALDLGYSVAGRESRKVVFLEDDAAVSQLGDGRLDVLHLEGD